MSNSKKTTPSSISALALNQELISEEKKTTHQQFTFTKDEESKEPPDIALKSFEKQSTADTKTADDDLYDDPSFVKPKRRDATTNVLSFLN
jgi:hypothetical protein